MRILARATIKAVLYVSTLSLSRVSQLTIAFSMAAALVKPGLSCTNLLLASDPWKSRQTNLISFSSASKRTESQAWPLARRFLLVCLSWPRFRLLGVIGRSSIHFPTRTEVSSRFLAGNVGKDTKSSSELQYLNTRLKKLFRSSIDIT
ncbi:hypothetical protein FOVG_03240 [Fusarium oxysporum f. sp. pisi HDV247]|uniref:Uncharacterized protein n=1 Tax=Fusarium oxysporum f. sp. pisi HDV247 TaxID=1080344 RepID=W9Q5T4_FUSOX|nr:hypothetical protein FOVG_03240 [Fusarium oxysporum f. sp. pisi HDV247]EXA50622.1 hypothetical protein FOVG_03240 [Fusarium oxysporum f. sp. pisi HDV247]EXA50623.1 hypothetical protein FOVG_03240 [Fusarium oxysporum f. sp. pisi HDV247]